MHCLYMLKEDVNESDTHSGMTALHFSSSSGFVEITRILLEYGANTETKDITGWTPLHYSCDKSHGKVVELLLKHGADVNAVTNKSTTPCQIAETSGSYKLVNLLKKHMKQDEDEKAPDNDEQEFLFDMLLLCFQSKEEEMLKRVIKRIVQNPLSNEDKFRIIKMATDNGWNMELNNIGKNSFELPTFFLEE